MATVAARPANMTSVSSASWCGIPKSLELHTQEPEVKSNTPWFQLGGHVNSLKPSGQGSVYKTVSGANNMEVAVYQALDQDDQLRDLVPRFFKVDVVNGGRERRIEIQDLLYGFENPHVMVLKMGTRTYLESDEIQVEREDLFKKMFEQDPTSVTEAERRIGKVTKKRYMEFREKKSSSALLGFRIEGVRFPNKEPQTNFKNLSDPKRVRETIGSFLSGRPAVRKNFLQRLNHIRSCLQNSEYFKRHEMIGTSLYLIFDEKRFGAWLIDFGKTRRVPDGIELNHRSPWQPGSHEEGFLFGLDQIIKILEDAGAATPETNGRQDR